MAVDALGNEIKVGDFVVYGDSGSHAGLKPAFVTKINKVMILLSHGSYGNVCPSNVLVVNDRLTPEWEEKKQDVEFDYTVAKAKPATNKFFFLLDATGLTHVIVTTGTTQSAISSAKKAYADALGLGLDAYYRFFSEALKKTPETWRQPAKLQFGGYSGKTWLTATRTYPLGKENVPTESRKLSCNEAAQLLAYISKFNEESE